MILGEGILVDWCSNSCKYNTGFIVWNGTMGDALSPTSFPIFHLPSTGPSTQTRLNSHPDLKIVRQVCHVQIFLLGFQCIGNVRVCSRLIRNQVLVSTTNIMTRNLDTKQSPISSVRHTVTCHTCHASRVLMSLGNSVFPLFLRAFSSLHSST